ncbi:unnamed protein product [Sphagnum tenellum]
MKEFLRDMIDLKDILRQANNRYVALDNKESDSQRMSKQMLSENDGRHYTIEDHQAAARQVGEQARRIAEQARLRAKWDEDVDRQMMREERKLERQMRR